jgi:hypothetical protein
MREDISKSSTPSKSNLWNRQKAGRRKRPSGFGFDKRTPASFTAASATLLCSGGQQDLFGIAGVCVSRLQFRIGILSFEVRRERVNTEGIGIL